MKHVAGPATSFSTQSHALHDSLIAGPRAPLLIEETRLQQCVFGVGLAFSEALDAKVHLVQLCRRRVPAEVTHRGHLQRRARAVGPGLA